ncbi:hydroxymethylglutaryl-CoA synthase [Candidatus Gottesmanbacteria bacterium]|nr:hydroxymethylglutaryl-CoA synthase [Candidatus Gottesmanbacteria bacterium]
MKSVSIQGYGVYIPKYRLKAEEVAQVWGKNSQQVEKSLGIKEKSIAAYDEDTVTLAYEASVNAIRRAGIKPQDIEVFFTGSESHPYAVNPTSTIVAEFLGVGRNYLSADLEFACKAATTALINISALIASGMATTGIAVGADTAQAKPHDILEYTAASAAAAFILATKNNESIADLIDFTSYSSDTPDFWRRDGIPYPSHGGRFTQATYFAHIEGAAKRMLDKAKLTPKDFDYCVFHMPNGKFPREIARKLGFTPQQLEPSLIIDQIGNPYSASSLLGLSSVLDIARPNQLIFMVSYGSGAGSDAFVLKTSRGVNKKRTNSPLLSDYLKQTRNISYIQYLKFGRKI